ncbi:MAG: OmpA family protein [Verrucomicrobiota bacterium]
MHRSKLSYVFLTIAALIAASAILMLIFKPTIETREKPAPTVPPDSTSPAPPVPGEMKENPPVVDPGKSSEQLGEGATSADPAELVGRIAKALEAGDLAELGGLLGQEILDEETMTRLHTITATPPKIREGGIREVGELELNKRTRWAIQLDDSEPGRDTIWLELVKTDGKWVVSKFTLPPAAGTAVSSVRHGDPLGVSDSFLQAIFKQDFEHAKSLVDPKTISDAKIAGLCILFEEGDYKLRDNKPLRAMFQRDDIVGYLANLQAAESTQTAQFSLTLRKAAADENWRISEINLDQLLADYAKRVAGGDVYYSPLVKNPAGGDTLALYFDFDEAEMNPRAKRQLEIVSLILQADSGKKISLSGHTDALGSDPYNDDLSAGRADAVKKFLIDAGVSEQQIVTVGKGASQPRRPNVTELGEDNPSGRRANRRTEIYLDF